MILERKSMFLMYLLYLISNDLHLIWLKMFVHFACDALNHYESLLANQIKEANSCRTRGCRVDAAVVLLCHSNSIQLLKQCVVQIATKFINISFISSIFGRKPNSNGELR